MYGAKMLVSHVTPIPDEPMDAEAMSGVLDLVREDLPTPKRKAFRIDLEERDLPNR